jgi:hypothetical protein
MNRNTIYVVRLGPRISGHYFLDEATAYRHLAALVKSEYPERLAEYLAEGGARVIALELATGAVAGVEVAAEAAA